MIVKNAVSFYTRILSIDPGAKRFGWAVIDFDIDEDVKYQPSYVSSGVIGLDRTVDDTYTAFKNKLIEYFIPEIDSLLNEYEPDLVVFEWLPLVNVKGNLGQRVLGFAAAVTAQVLLIQKKIEYKEIGATSVKATLCGTNRATKTQIRNHILGAFPQLEPRRKELAADETDAIAIGLAWMAKGTTWNKKDTDT